MTFQRDGVQKVHRELRVSPSPEYVSLAGLQARHASG